MGLHKLLKIVAIAAICVAVFLLFRNAGSVLDKSAEIEALVSRALGSAGVSMENLLKETKSEKRLRWRFYVHTYREYEVTGDYELRRFGDALEKVLAGSPYRIGKSDYELTDSGEIASCVIKFGRFNVFSLKLKRAKAKRLSMVRKKYPHPKVAVILDDFGYNMRNVDAVLETEVPVTFSILPNLRFSAKIAEEAHAAGREVMLHLPLEPHRYEVREEIDTIDTEMTKEEVLEKLKRAVESVPYLSGVSNHMGSKATENALLMSIIFDYLKENNLFFVDSLVTSKSVCGTLASSMNVKFARRSIFLDNETNEEYIKQQIKKLRRMAFRTGSAIAIGHDRPLTVKVLARMLPQLGREGIEFVRVSELTK